MIPLLFGSSQRPLIGMYSPSIGQDQRRGVVICPPLGQEHIRAHRTCRVLAVRLSQKGQHVLRFDYYGTGDSGGVVEDLTLHGAIRDTHVAIEEIQDIATVRGITLVGLRAGALVAALSARDVAQVDKLVLWDPVSDGGEYVEEQIRVGESMGSGGDMEARGFLFTRSLQHELQSSSLTDAETFPSRVLIVTSADTSRHRRLHEHVRSRGSEVEFDFLASAPPWEERADLGVGALPADAVNRIAEW